MDIMAYLLNAFAAGEVSHIIFTQAFGSASALDIHNFYVALAAETQEEQDAFMAIVESVGYDLPPDDDPTGMVVSQPLA